MQTAVNIRKSDKWIPWYFVAFFVFVAIVDSIFVTMALSTHRGVVTEQAYTKGLAYNQTILAAEQQEALGWTSEITHNGSEIAFKLLDENNTLIEPSDVVAYFFRITQEGYDFSTPLVKTDNGIYRADVNFPLKGQWHVRVKAVWNQQHYQQSKRIVVK